MTTKLYISLPDFLSFYEKTKYPETFTSFLNNGKVVINGKKEPEKLNDYVQRKGRTPEEVRLLWNEVENRIGYLTRFYKMSLYVDETKHHFGQHLVPMYLNNINNNTQPLLKNVIRNMYWKEILKETQSGIDNIPTYMDTIDGLFKEYLIHYKLLSPNSLGKISREKREDGVEGGRFGSVLSSMYFRASIMNPYVPFSLNKRKFKSESVFTPTLGWTSYAYGLLESGVKEYVGIDVIPVVCKKTDKFIHRYYPSVKKDIRCIPSEKLAKDNNFITRYRDHFDLIFFSPPYFALEKYPGKEQSINNYSNYTEWLNKYWRPTVELCSKVLSKEGSMCYILSDYGSSVSSKQHYSLMDDMQTIVKESFKFKSKIPMYNKNKYVLANDKPPEQIFIFQKK